MNKALRMENRIKILKENGKDNGRVVRKLIRKLRKLNDSNR